MIAPRIPEWTFADRVRKVRRELGLTQVEMAERIGVDDKRYSQWEAGGNRPRDIVKIAQRIEVETGYSASWLVGLSVVTGPGQGPDGGMDVSRQKHWARGALHVVEAVAA